MTKERNATRAGLFIVISMGLIVGVIIAVGKGGRFSDATQTRVVRFKLSDDLGGLRVGDDVRVGGYKVGSVGDIEPADLDGADPHLSVRFSIPARYTLRSDARVGVQVTLTGAPCINIDSLGSTDHPPVTGDLVGRPDPKTVALAALGDAGADIAGIAREVRARTLPKVNDAVDSFHQAGDAGTLLVRHVNDKIDPVTENVHVVADKTGAMMDSVHEMIGPSTKDFHGTVADLHEITTDLKGKLPAMLTKVDGAIDGTRAALESVQQTVDNTRDISASVRAVVSGNKGKLDGIIAAAKSTTENLKAASVEIRHSPWRLLYKPSEGEVANLTLYDSARQFSEGATQLNDAAQALRDATQDKQAEPKHVQELINHLEKTFANFHEVEQKLWTDVKQ